MASYVSVPPSYPLTELHCARFDFVERWNATAQRDPLVRTLSEWHYQYPPTIRVINCIEYPFESENSVYQMPQLKVSRSNEPPLKMPRIKFTPFGLSQRCSKLTEDVLYGQPEVSKSDSHKQSFLYVCDNCSFSSPVQSVAENHLNSEQHVSCSRYGLCDSAVHGEFVEDQTYLCEPRALYNGTVATLAWLSNKIVVVCPTCYLVFPDKLMCAYHHQSHHRKFCPKYAFGTVLAVREVTVYNDFNCERCKRQFQTQLDYINHWAPADSGGCPSPFEPVPCDPDQSPSKLIVQAYCDACRARFERFTEQQVQAEPSGVSPLPNKRRKRGRSAQFRPSIEGEAYTDSRSTHWFYSFSRFCVNHVYLHFPQFSGDRLGYRMHIRFIQLSQGSALTLPPYQRTSDSDLLLFCIHECKRFVTYLRNLKGSKRALYKRAKCKLNELLEQARLGQTN